jgi:hypothetical protein
MTAPSIGRYPMSKLDDLPEGIRARMLEVQEKAGFIPNVFLTLAIAPTSGAPSKYDDMNVRSGPAASPDNRKLAVRTMCP